LDRLKTTVFTAFVIAILLTPTASAQAVAANISVVSGNGQMISSGNAFKGFTFFYPMVVKVTDASGNPIGGKTVYWNQVPPFSGGVVPSFDTITTTSSNGLSVARLYQGVQVGSVLQPFLQSVISATVDAVSVNFTETQALSDANGSLQVNDTLVNPLVFGTLVTGPAGSTGTTPIQIHVDGKGVPVPNVSLRLLSKETTTAGGQVVLDPNSPSASCLSAPGADPGSVLTDANGNATCYPVFGPVAGAGPISVLVGGVDPIEFDQTITVQPLSQALAFDEFFNWIQLTVTPVTPGRVAVVTGNNQSVDPGRTSAPLVAVVTDGTGAVTIANQTVVWTVLSGGQATVSPISSITNSAGQAQTTVTLAPNASGLITVRAALSSNSGLSTNFTLNTNVVIANIAKVSGDLQTTQSGQNFGAPLVVQVNGTNTQPVSNQAIGFAVTSGTATLSSQSVLTNASGQAQVIVTAGSTAGTVTVNAFIGTFSQTFTLTIIPPGPALSNGSFYNAGGATRIGALSPCSLVTVLTTGLAPNVQGMVFNANAFGPWATTLAGDKVTVNGVAAPIYSVGNVSGAEQLTFQVPCETAVGNAVPITINVSGGSASITFPVVAASPGIFETVMSDGVRRAVVIRPDGSFVSLQNPARTGEAVRVYVTGLGPTAPTMVTGTLPYAGADSLALGQVIVGVNNGGTPVFTSRVSPNLIGVFEVAFQVPSGSGAPTGNDVVLSVAVNAPGDSTTRYSNGSKLPIAQ
jgi:uncharacterized protein (TIGR03437 family)